MVAGELSVNRGGPLAE
jgi:hypothetical protein